MVRRFNRRDAEVFRKNIISLLRMHQIMDETQIRSIVRKWLHFESKITGIKRSLPVFCEYIKYQETLLRLVSSKTSHKQNVKEKLEKLIINDIKQLLDLCMNTPSYQGEFDMLMLRLSFCRLTADFSTGTKVVDSLIESHSSNPKTWITAGKWFVHLDKANVAIHILQQGLKVCNNPVDTDIYEYLISLEVDSALGKYTIERLSVEQLEDREKKLVETLGNYMKDFAERDWEDSKFIILVIDMLDGYSFAKPIQKRLCEILAEKFGNMVKTWQLLVKRDLKETDKNQAYDTARERYQTGLNKLKDNASECRLLWCQYLDFLIDVDGKIIAVSVDENQTSFRKYLIDAFTEAADTQMLTDKYYVKWVSYAFNKDCEDAILKRGLKEFPSSIELRVFVLNRDLWGDAPTAEDTFEEAINACGDNALLLWTARLRYMYVKCDTEQIQAFYMKAIDPEKVPHVIVDNLKPRFIEWLGRTVSPDVALREYGQLADKKPYSKRLHRVTLQLLACCNSKSTFMPMIHHRLCSQFSKDSDVHFDFIYYHHQLDCKPIDERQEAMAKIYEEARKVLDETAFSALSIQYSDLKDKEMQYFPSHFQ